MRKQTFLERLKGAPGLEFLIFVAWAVIFGIAAVVLILNSLAPGVKSVGTFVLGIVCSIVSIASPITNILIHIKIKQ